MATTTDTLYRTTSPQSNKRVIRVYWEDNDFMDKIAYLKKLMRIVARDLSLMPRFAEANEYFEAFFIDPRDRSRRGLTKCDIGIAMVKLQMQRYGM